MAAVRSPAAETTASCTVVPSKVSAANSTRLGLRWGRGVQRKVTLVRPSAPGDIRNQGCTSPLICGVSSFVKLGVSAVKREAGDAALAAAPFESVPEAVPETVLATRALFRSGEAWARAGQCGKALSPLTRAVSSGAQELFAPTAMLALADCQAQESRPDEASQTLKQLWIR